MHSSTPSISEHLLCSVSSALSCKIWWYHNSISGYFWNNKEPTQKLWWASCWTLDTDTKKKHWQARIAFLQLRTYFINKINISKRLGAFFGGRKRTFATCFCLVFYFFLVSFSYMHWYYLRGLMWWACFRMCTNQKNLYGSHKTSWFVQVNFL